MARFSWRRSTCILAKGLMDGLVISQFPAGYFGMFHPRWSPMTIYLGIWDNFQFKIFQCLFFAMNQKHYFGLGCCIPRWIWMRQRNEATKMSQWVSSRLSGWKFRYIIGRFACWFFRSSIWGSLLWHHPQYFLNDFHRLKIHILVFAHLFYQ